MIDLKDWKKMKPGQLLTLANYHGSKLIFVKLVDDIVVMVIDDGDGELEEYFWSDLDVSKMADKRVKLTAFQRSDDYKFIIYLLNKEWHLSAGCRRQHGSTLKKLQAQCLEYWDDYHGTCLEEPHSVSRQLQEYPEGDISQRILLNRETRKKIKRAIGKLS